MSVQTSSSNDSLLPPQFSPLNLYISCIISKPTSFILGTFDITLILLLLPLCIFILHHGLQLWRQKKCSTSSAATVSHSDIFTYHMVVMELVRVFGSVFRLCGIYREHYGLLSVCSFLLYLTWFGETFFHVLTCVERYLAVVHPITYLSLRNQRGIRIRNISIACLWLLCVILMSLPVLMKAHYFFVNLSVMVSSLATISFCSVSVLCVLIGPGPGEQGGGRKRVDQSKLRAFYTIMSILGVLVLRVSANLALCIMHVLESSGECASIAFSFWLSLPSSLVLPLLFLHRAGRLVCWKKNNQ